MLYFENGTLHFDKMRCCQCGSCLAACSEDALKVSIDADGLTLLECDQNLCKMCGSCVSVCPAGRFPENYLNDEHHLDSATKSVVLSATSNMDRLKRLFRSLGENYKKLS